MTTYADRENSVAGSRPVEFYRFARGAGEAEEVWLHVSTPNNRTFNGETYAATPGLQRSSIKQSGETSTMQADVTLPRDVCLADEFRGTQAPAPIRLTIWRAQAGLADSQAKPIYSGEVGAAVFQGSILTLTCTRAEARWGEGLVRTHCERSCPFMLFDTFCGADPEAVTFTARLTVVSADKTVITVEELDAPVGSHHLAADATYYLVGVVDRFGHKGFVVKQDADELTLQTPLKGATVGDLVKLTAGCNRQPSGCIVHDNIERFGGFQLIPDRDPWKGVR